MPGETKLVTFDGVLGEVSMEPYQSREQSSTPDGTEIVDVKERPAQQRTS